MFSFFANTGPLPLLEFEQNFPDTIYISCCFPFHILLTVPNSFHLIVGSLHVPQTLLVKHAQLLNPGVFSEPHMTELSAGVDKIGITLLPETPSLASPHYLVSLPPQPAALPFHSPSLASPPLETPTDRRDYPGPDLIP